MLHQNGLPFATGTDQHQRLTSINREVNTTQNLLRAELLMKAAHDDERAFYRGRHGRFLRCSEWENVVQENGHKEIYHQQNER